MSNTVSVRARKKTKKDKPAHILIRPDDVGGHVVEEHHEPADHSFGPSEVKVRAFSASPEEAKSMVKHVVHTLGLPLDTDDDDEKDESSEDEE